MSDIKAGDRVRRVGGSIGDIVNGTVYTVHQYIGHSISLDEIGGTYDPSLFKLVEEDKQMDKRKDKKEKAAKELANKKARKAEEEKRRKDASWEFETSSHILVNSDEIEKTLTREHPMCIVHASDGTCMVYIHDTVYEKTPFLKKSLETELYESLKPFWGGDWPLKTSATLSRVVCAVKAVRSARLKKRFRNQIKCKVEMVKI